MSTGKEKKSSLARSVSVVSGATGFSRVLGLVREQVMAYFFGASLATDAFVTAFRIPNLLRDMFAEGALSSAFVPVFKEKLVKEDESEAFGLANKIASAVLVFVGGIVLLGIIAAPAIIFISANGFTEDPFKFDLTVSLTRLMFVYLLLVSLSSLVMGMLNSFGRFGIPALSPALFNLGMILSMLFLRWAFDLPIYALAVGVLLGGAGQLLVQVPPLFKLGYRFRWDFSLLDEGVRKVTRLFTPMVIGMSAGRINILLSTLIASFLIEGAISYLNYSFRLMHFPLGVFGVALGTVSLPRASEIVARGDLAELGRAYRESLFMNLLLILPSAVFLAMFAGDVVSLIYQWGEFSKLDADNTALALMHYSYGLIGFSAVRVSAPFYYAMGDARLPTRFSVIAVGINMALYYPLVKLLGFAGLAAATSLAALVNFGLLLFFLPRKGVPLSFGRLGLTAFRVLAAAVIAVYVGRMLPFDFSADLPEVAARIVSLVAAMVSIAVMYFFLCWVFRVRELGPLLRSLIGRKTPPK